MDSLPEPIRSVLRDYCHVEWFEVAELANDVRQGGQKFDSVLLREQFVDLISNCSDFVLEVNEVTGNEFESEAEVLDWVWGVFSRVFAR